MINNKMTKKEHSAWMQYLIELNKYQNSIIRWLKKDNGDASTQDDDTGSNPPGNPPPPPPPPDDEK